MARYTGPKTRISRKFKEPIFGPDKWMERKPHAPGQHGLTAKRRKKESEYSTQLREKQKAKYIYGVLERQFSNLYKEASRQKGVTGENLLRMLEQRLDNMVFRAGWASTRPQARQFVSHGMINVNGKRVDIPSYRVRKGDVISLRDKSRQMIVIRHNMDTLDRLKPAWIEMGAEGFQVTINELPVREQIDVPVREQLIVELYSK